MRIIKEEERNGIEKEAVLSRLSLGFSLVGLFLLTFDNEQVCDLFQIFFA